eukprot:GILI01024690.1.p1 GENE.GILI01024690.1~~GILI01024690.1.p1  ORF type:complete len:367 (-),score=-0.55 GILI01024690.1:30-1130(-)
MSGDRSFDQLICDNHPIIVFDRLDLVECVPCHVKIYGVDEIRKHLQDAKHLETVKTNGTPMPTSYLTLGNAEGILCCALCLKKGIFLTRLKSHTESKGHIQKALSAPSLGELLTRQQQISDFSIEKPPECFKKGTKNGSLICTLCNTGELYKKDVVHHITSQVHQKSLARSSVAPKTERLKKEVKTKALCSVGPPPPPQATMLNPFNGPRPTIEGHNGFLVAGDMPDTYFCKLCNTKNMDKKTTVSHLASQTHIRNANASQVRIGYKRDRSDEPETDITRKIATTEKLFRVVVKYYSVAANQWDQFSEDNTLGLDVGIDETFSCQQSRGLWAPIQDLHSRKGDVSLVEETLKTVVANYFAVGTSST